MRRAAAGVTLIELMVALLIGTVLVLGLVEVFSASRTAYQLSTGLARVQENGRFAMDFLQRDLRMAGHLGCVNDQARFLPGNVTPSRPGLASTFLTNAQQTAANYAAAPAALRFDAGIQGYDAKVGGSGGQTGSGSEVTLATSPVLGSATSWAPAIPEPLWTQLNSGTGKPVANSDIVFLRFFAPTGAQIKTFAPGATATLTFNKDQAVRLTEGVTDPRLFGIADCMNAAVFQANTYSVSGSDGMLTVTDGTGMNKSGLLGMQNFTVGQAMLYRAESVVYYVGVNAQGNPSLYRLRYTLTGTGTDPAPLKEELVEGVENLQLEYGLDSRLGKTERPTGNIGESAIASLVEAKTDPTTVWQRVGMIQVGVLARSPDRAAAPKRDEAQAGVVALSPLGIKINAPDDGRYRTVYEDSVALRNRLFGN